MLKINNVAINSKIVGNVKFTTDKLVKYYYVSVSYCVERNFTTCYKSTKLFFGDVHKKRKNIIVGGTHSWDFEFIKTNFDARYKQYIKVKIVRPGINLTKKIYLNYNDLYK